MEKTPLVIRPNDHGRRMTLDDFEHAEAFPGQIYELGRGVISMEGVQDIPHLAQVSAIQRMLYGFTLAHPARIHSISSRGESKLLLRDLQSERHPDISVYRTAPPDVEHVWNEWIPEIVIEVVSPSSAARDYDQKPEEYLAFGVSEYWVVDAAKQEVLVLRRANDQWSPTTLNATAKYRTPLLPDFELDVAQIFTAT